MRKTFFSAKFIKHCNEWCRDLAQSQYLGISKPQVDKALSNLLLSHLQYAGELDLAISKSVLQPHLFCDSQIFVSCCLLFCSLAQNAQCL